MKSKIDYSMCHLCEKYHENCSDNFGTDNCRMQKMEKMCNDEQFNFMLSCLIQYGVYGYHKNA